jgi:hypothetical protein
MRDRSSAWFGDIVSIAWHVVALVVIVVGLGVAGYVVLALLLSAANKMTHQALQAARETVYRERGTPGRWASPAVCFRISRLRSLVSPRANSPTWPRKNKCLS